MKKIIYLSAILCFVFVSCNPEEPEDPQPLTYQFIDLVHEPLGECEEERCVTCGGPGEDCSFSGQQCETYSTCRQLTNDEILEKSEAFRVLNDYISKGKFNELFINPIWHKILPDLRYNRRIVAFIKDKKLSASMFNDNVLAIYKPGESGELTKDNVLFWTKINNNYKSPQ